jgi:hypothetical protein
MIIERTSKISNPAISKTPIKESRLKSLASNVELHLLTNQWKIRANNALANAPIDQVTCSRFWPLLTLKLID